MARPSVAQARRRQILEATIRCIAGHGMSGASLDRIAEEAGMARGHVRHFAGNRDDILAAAAVLLYFGEVPEPGADMGATGHPGSFFPSPDTTVDGALEYLFGEFAEPDATNIAALAFVDAGRTNPDLHAVVVSAYASAESELVAALSAAYPAARPDDVERTAKGVMSIAIGNVFMSDLEVSAERTRLARASAELLIAALARIPESA
ncbi:MAG: TetR family transcriptional regulator [Microbacterium sp.]|uniref:TetR/AcrR family transcriptional regulator n=1 Tax=Microbacterium sp. TaxID=51671 RepID=UPI001AC10D65|nr:TetR/AcrR family transcriptional regulator [Microbacterium sp.]MBN9176417.1 TetR family transcriptional regulator [Microbacterium sp.]